MFAWDVKTWEGKKVLTHGIQHSHMKDQEGASSLPDHVDKWKGRKLFSSCLTIYTNRKAGRCFPGCA